MKIDTDGTELRRRNNGKRKRQGEGKGRGMLEADLEESEKK